MPLKIVVFSADTIRGSMIQKALQKWVDVPAYETPAGAGVSGVRYADNIPVLLLQKNLLHAADVITKDRTPNVVPDVVQIVVLDTKGYFPGELEKFSNSCKQLFKDGLSFKILAIGNHEHKDSAILNDVVSHWCMDTPIDPVLIVSKVKQLLTEGGKGAADGGMQSETEVLMDNLIGFLNIK